MPRLAGHDHRGSNSGKTLAVCVFLTLITWFVFGQTIRYGFVNFDDDRYVYEEPHVNHGLTPEGLRWVWTHSHASLWHPLTTISHMIDCQVYGLRTGGHHFTNVLLHNIAAVLLFLVLWRLTSSAKGKPSAVAALCERRSQGHNSIPSAVIDHRYNIWCSAVVAMLFAIHPMRVESVAWISERKDILSGLFFMLTLAAYHRYTKAPSFGRYLIVSIAVVGGLLSKATFVAVPFVLLLVDYWPLGRMQRAKGQDQRGEGQEERTRSRKRFGRLIVEKVPLVVLAALASVATFFAQTVTLASLDQLPLLPRIKNAVVSVVIYLFQMFWPVNLAVFYPHPHDQLPNSVVLGSASLVIAISVIAVLIRRKCPYIFVGWFWYLVMLLPVMGVVQAGLQGHADRFTYLPHIGLSIALVWSFRDLSENWPYRRWVVGSMIAAVTVALVLCAYRQTTYWRDSISLWTRDLAVTSDNQTAHQNLAAALWQSGRKDEARSHARAAAIIHWQAAVKDYPTDPNHRNELAVALIQDAQPRAAVEQWETSLKIDPNNGNAANNLAWVLATYPDDGIRNGAMAVELAEKAVKLSGGKNPMVLRTLGAAYAEHGDFPAAIGTAERAAELAAQQQNVSLAETLRHELALYRESQPYRELPQQ